MKLERLVELIVAQRHKLAEAYARIRELEEALDELRKQASPTAKLDEPFSVKAEEKRQAARGRKSQKKKLKSRRRGRLAEVGRWATHGRSCSAELLEELNLSSPDKSILDTLLPIPAD